MQPELPLKVLLVLPFFYPHRGGSQKYAEEIYVHLINNHPDCHIDVLAYNTDHVEHFEEYRGLKIYRIPCWNIIPARFVLPNPLALYRILKQLSYNKYDFVNTHIRFFDPTWWVWFYAKKIGAKSFYTGHVASYPIHQNKLVEVIAKLVDITIGKYSVNKYELITFTNKTAQNFFVNVLGLKKNSYIVYGGVDTKFFAPTNKQNRVLPKINLKIDNEAILITYLGRLIWTKGVTYLYEAITLMLKETDQKMIFVLAGPGELEMKLRNQVKQDGLEEQVLILGDMSYTQVRDLLAISDIFVNPSHHNEGFPNTILEAGSSGCYVIATDNAGTWEVIRDKETGQLVPQKNVQSLYDAISWALNNKEKRNKIANNFRNELVQSFDWNVIAEQLYKLLIKIR